MDDDKELNWLPVGEMLKVRDTVMVYKCVNNLHPSIFVLSLKSDLLFTIVQPETITNFKSHYSNHLAGREPFLTEQCPYGMNEMKT